MEFEKICFICQDFESSVGHKTKDCPNIICEKCGQKGHVKVQCMFKMENLPLPDEILLKIFSYLSFKDIGSCSQVCKRTHEICHDKSLKYNSYLKFEVV